MRSFYAGAVLYALAAASPVLARAALPRQQQAPQLYLPETTGPYKVGTVVFPLTDISRLNPFAGAEQTGTTPDAYRRLVVSVFYPADIPSDGAHNFTYAPAFPPVTASVLDGVIGAPAGTAALFKTRSYLGAPMLRPTSHAPNQQKDDFPLLLFGHGFGAMRLIYTARLQELASRGWIIVNIDHTYDAQLVEFPDTGELVPGYANDTAAYDFIGGVEGLQKLRAADVDFVLGQLRTNETVRGQVPGLGRASSSTCSQGGGKGKGGLRMDRVGAFGHSLGGAAAAQAVSSYHKNGIVCGINLDGAYWGKLPADGLLADETGGDAAARSLSFMQMANSNVTIPRPSWTEFWDTMQRQSVRAQRQFAVSGTEHNSYTDGAVYYSLLGLDAPDEMYGTIKGLRMLEVEVGYVDAFFGACLKGESLAKLDDLHKSKYPESYILE